MGLSSSEAWSLAGIGNSGCQAGSCLKIIFLSIEHECRSNAEQLAPQLQTQELADEYACQASRIRSLWSKMRKMWSNTPGKSRSPHIQAMKDKMRKATFGHQM